VRLPVKLADLAREIATAKNPISGAGKAEIMRWTHEVSAERISA
jgi:hypothetical protein